jgi:predicted AlkP superfamily phosphohydrolase/phosphomutase
VHCRPSTVGAARPRRRRWFAASTALALALLSVPALAAAQAARAHPRVIVLGFDGIDPKLVQQYMDQGQLPHLKALALAGTFSPLGTTTPAESPVSWATFATGQNPGQHGIFDFLHRKPGTYYPEIALAEEITQPLLPDKRVRLALCAAAGAAVFLVAFLVLRLMRARARTAAPLAGALAALACVVAVVALLRWVPYELPSARSTRGGIPFWERLSPAGVRCTVIDAPVTFPAPQGVAGLHLTTGLGTPDLRQTWGYWTLFSSASFDKPFSETGGNLVHVVMNGGHGTTEIRGPRNFLAERDAQGSRPEIPVPMTIERTGPQSLRLTVQGQRIDLGAGQWSDWVHLTFRLNPLVKLIGMTRFKLMATEPEFRLYQEPLNWDPHHLPPTVHISTPHELASDLARRYGLRETIGWTEATNPLKDDAIDIDTFLQDLEFSLRNRERVIMGELARADWDLFVGVFLETDRMQHMMYRFIDPQHPFYDAQLAAKYGDRIPWVYQQMDRIVGQVVAQHVDDQTLLLVVSDHGFHSFRRGVSLNTWLVRNGFMTLRGLSAEANYQKLEDLFDPEGRFFKNVDWSRTQAFCLGLGSIYVNLRQRERNGAVSQSDYESVRSSIIDKLMQLRDPQFPDLPVVHEVKRREEVFHGARVPLAADLFVGFNDGYRVSWQTAAGGIPPEVFEDNRNNWSGDHCSVAPEISSGIFFCNRVLPDRPRHIQDVAATVLAAYGAAVPAELDGTPLTHPSP